MNLKTEEPLDRSLSGLGGWLVLVQIGLFISVARTIYNLYEYILPMLEDWDILTSELNIYYHRLLPSLIVFETVYNVFILLFCVFILVIFYKRKAIVPKLIVALYAINLIAVITDYWMVQQIPITAELDDGEAIRALTQAVTGAAIWIPYFLVSKRVRHTFTK